MNEPLLEVNGLEKYFSIKSGFFRRELKYLQAVDGISFKIKRGQMFGLVGESGCGKTTTGRLLVKSIAPTAGEIVFNGKSIIELDDDEVRDFRQSVQMIFQDPYQSLNPRMTIFDIIAEPLKIHKIGAFNQREELVAGIMEKVGLSPAASFIFRYPHELSGGQRQRVAIARAMVIKPDFIVADEPTSMLDVSIRTQVIELMKKLQEESRVSYLYITHDLAVARYLCTEIAVMYLGKIVESGEIEKVTQNPAHPYTQALISAVPIPDPSYQRESIAIIGGVSKPIDLLPRCRFYDRCYERDQHCQSQAMPDLHEIEEQHFVACYQR
ncbi:MAG: ATP-binding cassette domain-containing protein [Halanaerobiales bacterium]|nr:ATP-binding cassette domain-containing protein [Halanaerobiales bacterium]